MKQAHAPWELKSIGCLEGFNDVWQIFSTFFKKLINYINAAKLEKLCFLFFESYFMWLL